MYPKFVMECSESVLHIAQSFLLHFSLVLLSLEPTNMKALASDFVLSRPKSIDLKLFFGRKGLLLSRQRFAVIFR